jgi:hypothetical protein
MIHMLKDVCFELFYQFITIRLDKNCLIKFDWYKLNPGGWVLSYTIVMFYDNTVIQSKLHNVITDIVIIQLMWSIWSGPKSLVVNHHKKFGYSDQNSDIVISLIQDCYNFVQILEFSFSKPLFLSLKVRILELI